MANLGIVFDPMAIQPWTGEASFERTELTESEVVAQFADKIRATGMTPPANIISDGTLHRFDPDGGRGDAGFYCLYTDGIPAGFFGDWRQGGEGHKWRADIGRAWAPAEETVHRQRMDDAKRQRDEERDRLYAEAAVKALAIYASARPAGNDHPYAQRKGVCFDPTTARELTAEELLFQHQVRPVRKNKATGEYEPLTRRLLILPLETEASDLASLQFIDEDGRKANLAGGKSGGNFWTAQAMPLNDGAGVTIMIGEGAATVLSARAATGFLAVAAFSCGNLLKVAEAMRRRYPAARLVILADRGNGEADAHKAGLAVNAPVAVPFFGDGSPEATDINDLANLAGLEEVERQILAALAGAPEPTPPGAVAVSASAAPLPLPKLPAVPPLPLEILPDVMGPWIGDAADRTRFPPDSMAVGAMASLGSLLGRKLGIRLKGHDDWTEYANAWGIVIGTPSTLKSPARNAALSPLRAVQVAANNDNADLLKKYGEDLADYELRASAYDKEVRKLLAKNPNAPIDLEKPNEPSKPVMRALWTTDATAEKLGELLVENPNGILIDRDELSGFLMAMEDERKAEARGFFLSGWSGNEGYRFDRIGRGTIIIPNFAISIFGGIQPGPLARYVRGAYGGEKADGFLQRFQLAVWPESTPFEYVDRWSDSAARQRVNELFARVDGMTGDEIGMRDKFGDGPPFIRLSSAAQPIFADWYTNFMTSQQRDEHQNAAIAAHFGKFPGLVGKLALGIHVADDPDGREVSERTLLKALGWIEYLTPHARRIYHAVEHPETGAAELLLARLKRGELPPSFKAWEISRKCWHGLTDRAAVKKACRLLFEFGWLIEIDAGGSQGVGRPADPIYAVSSAARPAL